MDKNKWDEIPEEVMEDLTPEFDAMRDQALGQMYENMAKNISNALKDGEDPYGFKSAELKAKSRDDEFVDMLNKLRDLAIEVNGEPYFDIGPDGNAEPTIKGGINWREASAYHPPLGVDGDAYYNTSSNTCYTRIDGRWIPMAGPAENPHEDEAVASMSQQICETIDQEVLDDVLAQAKKEWKETISMLAEVQPMPDAPIFTFRDNTDVPKNIKLKDIQIGATTFDTKTNESKYWNGEAWVDMATMGSALDNCGVFPSDHPNPGGIIKDFADENRHNGPQGYDDRLHMNLKSKPKIEIEPIYQAMNPTVSADGGSIHFDENIVGGNITITDHGCSAYEGETITVDAGGVDIKIDSQAAILCADNGEWKLVKIDAESKKLPYKWELVDGSTITLEEDPASAYDRAMSMLDDD